MNRVIEDRCRHDMLIFSGYETCTLCKGIDDSVELTFAGVPEGIAAPGDLIATRNLTGVRLSVGFAILES